MSEYRHPAGRTCSGAAATLTALATLLAVLARKAAR